MKMKRILALALAFAMFASSLAVGAGSEVTYAYETEQVLSELSKGQTNKNNLVVEKDTSSEEKRPSAEQNGVLSGSGAAALDKADSAVKEEAKDKTSETIDVTVEKVDKSDVTADLKSDSLNNVLLNEQTVTEKDMVDVIIVFDDASVIDDDPNAKINFFTK